MSAERLLEELELHIRLNEDDWCRNPQLQYARFQEEFYREEANQPKEEKSELSFDLETAIQKGEIVLWHFDDNTRSRFVEVKAVNYIDKNKPLGVWLGGGWISFDMIERLPNQPKEKPQQQSVDAIAVLKEVRTYFINKRFGQGILNKVVDALDNYEENTLNQDKVREATCDDCEKDAKVDITGVGLYCHEHAKDRI